MGVNIWCIHLARSEISTELPPIKILFQSKGLIVLDKPAGLPVHAGPRGGLSVEDWFPLLSRRKDGPWLAHRLDADTSGCLVIALRRAALLEAQAAFAGGRAEKVYWAVVRGGPVDAAGVVDLPLLKQSTPAGWRMVTGALGQTARTAWRVRGRAEGLAWLELRPLTGRTHQVRVHCAALGCPVLGDSVYGGGAGPLQLLAHSIWLPLTPSVMALAPPPCHMLPDLTACGWAGEPAAPEAGEVRPEQAQKLRAPFSY